ncbi:succinylglutamate desuccinylase [Marinobacter sp. Arc7-DN-1]|uniref:succinylglutamate desuccinylase n=1 Tax=Marinobacter sp. Arc7-DN-1 TaxID=2304594 RepID=UPI000E44C0B7|nr:succinylglutamate desuccinylase [Marinobacter sp. Arc7-DN-1]AXS83196.1 succinylglutamate desuccinylase [Marinobacter sp. Arc7-DN-1]
MSAKHDLFGTHSDWLFHTLDNSKASLPETKTFLPDGTRISRKAVGVLDIVPPAGRGNPNSEAIIVSAGVHGNETAPVEVLNELVSELINGEWELACPILLILGNPPAMVAGERFTEVNLNRLFNGAHGRSEYDGLAEAARAQLLEEACRQFAMANPQALYHYDLHTAIRPSHRERFALYPFVAGRQVPVRQCDFLLEAEVETLLLQHKAGTTFSSFSASLLKAESFTVELGKVRPFGQNDPGRFSGIRDALRRRLRGQPAPSPQPPFDQLTVFEVVHEILNTGKNFRFHIPDDVANFTEYQPGTVIWEDDETSYRVGHSPEAIVFPNPEVPVGQRVGLMIRPKTGSKLGSDEKGVR